MTMRDDFNRRNRTRPGMDGASGGGGTQLKRGYLSSGLTAATGGGASAGTGTMDVWGKTDLGLWNDTGENITITNRDTTLTGASGDFVIVAKFGTGANVEWQVIWISCTGG